MLRSVHAEIVSGWDEGLIVRTGPWALELHMAHHQAILLMDRADEAHDIPVVLETILEPSSVRTELVGFADEPSRQLYLSLRAVPKIGRKSALAALESGSWRDTLYAVAMDDLRWLQQLEGIGPAKAKAIAADLRRVYHSAMPAPPPVPLREWISAREQLVNEHGVSADQAEHLLRTQML
jgi:Holliday junction resolvasome RuvABC DNA-binding subunit